MFKQSEGNPHNHFSVHMLSFKKICSHKCPSYILCRSAKLGLQACTISVSNPKDPKWVDNNSQTDQKVQTLLPAQSSCRDLWKMFSSFLCTYFHGKSVLYYFPFSVSFISDWQRHKSDCSPNPQNIHKYQTFILVPQPAAVFDEEVIRELKLKLKFNWNT